MDEWAVKGAVMKTGLGGEKVRVRGRCVLGGQHEREEKVGYAEGRTDRLRNAAKGGKDKERKTGMKIRKTT